MKDEDTGNVYMNTEMHAPHLFSAHRRTCGAKHAPSVYWVTRPTHTREGAAGGREAQKAKQAAPRRRGGTKKSGGRGGDVG